MSRRRIMRPPVVPEKVVQAQITQLLRSLGATVYKLGGNRPKGDYAGTMQSPGLPDLYAMLPVPTLRPTMPPQAIWIECKRIGGRQRVEQKAFEAGCQQCAVPYVLGGVPQVMAFLVRGGWMLPQNLERYAVGTTETQGER